ncbi:DUF2534 family protein (plasmid) [Pantoea sp. Nvir]|uniref:DUF2534 family protein n=1 Tax=Pantoea sp. Nvir TaxID=2576760 RepID=UPI001356B2EC|nr:DUF2534 family protein [Pantoea sp. Nvir]MXP67122.1 DUF2534 family protein [Pantoea sp. Nvir]
MITHNPAQTLLNSWLVMPYYSQGVIVVLALRFVMVVPILSSSLLISLARGLLRWRNEQFIYMSQPETLPNKQSPLSIVRRRFFEKQKSKSYFLRSVVILWLIIGTVIGKAIISGVIDQYKIVISEWSLMMYVTQGLMIVLYTSVFTGLMSIPLWYFFLGKNNQE